MEGSGHGLSLSNCHGTVAFDFRGANEDHLNRRGAQPAFADGAIKLAAIGVPADRDVKRAESRLLRVFHFAGQQDGSGAGAEGGLQAHELPELLESLRTKQLEKRARLAAGDNEPVNLVELFGLFDQHDGGAKSFQAAAVRVEIALQGQDTDRHRAAPWLSSGSSG